jgi:hypothetical protein
MLRNERKCGETSKVYIITLLQKTMLQGRRNKRESKVKMGVWKLKRCTVGARKDQCAPCGQAENASLQL